MVNIDKSKFIQTYGIDDDNFISYLNKFKTFKKMISLGNTEIIPINKIKELYHLFIYYFSIGYDLDTIVTETISKINNLFFSDGDKFFSFILPPTNLIDSSKNFTKVSIINRVCQINFSFTTTNQLNRDDVIFDLSPSPITEFRDIITTTSGNKTMRINETGIIIYDSIASNTTVNGEVSFIFDR